MSATIQVRSLRCVEASARASKGDRLDNSSEHFVWSDERLLNEPMETFDLESLTLLAFVLEIESAFGVELDEEDVNRCKRIGDLVALIAAARNGSN
jgi:acyl carrier protein